MTGLSRGGQGRWLAGVCAGLAQVTGIEVGWIRLAFVATTVLGGVGIAIYLTCWLILPAGHEDVAPARGGVVVVARACGIGAGLVVLTLLAGVCAVFGFGWEILALAALILVGVLAGPRRLSPGWALLPVAALTLPAIAFAAAGVRLTTQTSPAIATPGSAAAVSRSVYHSGLNTLLVDLRRTSLPASGVVPLRIAAGMRRTIVALPADRCVRVVVRYHVNPFAVRLTSLLTGRTAPLFSDVVAFGRVFNAPAGVVTPAGSLPGPVLSIDFHSQGGSLYVRDYPDHVDPSVRPDWPGYQVHVELRPNIRGTPRRAALRLLAHWRARRLAQLADARLIDTLLPGPCVAAPVRRAVRAPAAHPRTHRPTGVVRSAGRRPHRRHR